jgi:hypothetical protein
MITLTLPSSASPDQFPNNTVSTFRTHLAEPLTLKNNAEYEVALAEIQFPSLISTANDCWVLVEKPGHISEKFYLEPGYYANLDDFLKEFLRVLRTTSGRFSLSSSAISRVISIHIHESLSLHMSSALSHILGFDNNLLENPDESTKTFVGDQPYDIYRGLDQIFVYCDICSDVTLGHVRAPLLRVVNSNIGKRRNVEYYQQCVTFSKMHYVPIARKNIDTILVYLRLGSGRSVPFMAGSCIVTLTIRRRILPHQRLTF